MLWNCRHIRDFVKKKKTLIKKTWKTVIRTYYSISSDQLEKITNYYLNLFYNEIIYNNNERFL